MTPDQITLTTIYTECNNHLREMDKLRDQLISFYLIVVGAFLALVNTNKINELVIPVSVLLIALGLAISMAILEFRIWHTRYSYTAQLLVALSRANKKDRQRVEISERKRSQDELHVNVNRKSGFMTMDWFFNRYTIGTEFWTFFASLIITLSPLYLLLKSLFLNSNSSVPMLVCLSSYFLVVLFYSAQKTYKKFVECPWAKWLLQGIYSDINITYDYEMDFKSVLE